MSASKGLFYCRLAALGVGLTCVLLTGTCRAQVPPVATFTFSGTHSAGAVTGTFTLDRLNGVLLDFDVLTPFYHYQPSNTIFIAPDEPSGFTVSLVALPITNPPQYVNLSFAGTVENFSGGATIPRVDILVNGQSNIAYFLTQEQFQGKGYTLTGSAFIATDQMTPFFYGIALGCLSRSTVKGVCDEGSAKNAAVANSASALLNATYLGPTTPQAELTFNATGGTGHTTSGASMQYGGLAASSTTSFSVTNTPAIAYSAGIGEFRDIITASFPPTNGKTGLLVLQYALVGGLSASSGVSFAEVVAHVYGPNFTNLQEASALHSCVFPLQSCVVNNMFTVVKPFTFTFGQPFALEFALIAQSGTTDPNTIGQGYLWTSSTGTGSGAASFGNTFVLTGMEFLDSNGNPLPNAPTITSVSGTTYSVNGVLVSFADFSAESELGQEGFEVNASFTLGAGSNGINPTSEDVGFQIGSFSSVIPSGSFKKDTRGNFVFGGVLNGVGLEAVIEPLGGEHFKFRAEGHGTNLARISAPVQVKIMIGDDGGTTRAALDD